MPGPSRRRRLAWLALAATLAILSGSREASAATSRRNCRAMGRDCCCLARPAASPCSMASGLASIPDRGDRASARAQAPDCECGTGLPSDPASRTEPAPSRPESRSGPGDLASSTPDGPDDAAAARSDHERPPDPRPSRLPLHLRLGRLLI